MSHFLELSLLQQQPKAKNSDTISKCFVAVLLTEETAKKLLREGWKDFKKVSGDNEPIVWCNDEVCITLDREGDKMCVNQLFPHMPSVEACGTPASALTYALLLMETYSEGIPKNRIMAAEAKKEALKRLLEQGSVGVAMVNSTIFDVAKTLEDVLASEGFPELTDSDVINLESFLRRQLNVWPRPRRVEL